MRIESLEKTVKITYFCCRIIDLKISKSYLAGLRFIGSEIDGAVFDDSDFTGMSFSHDLAKDRIPGDLKKILKNENLVDIGTSVKNSKFIFCTINDMRINNTLFLDSGIKHCWIEGARISNSVTMKNLDLRGTGIFESDLGKCEFHHIRFSRGFFIGKLMVFILILFKYFKILKEMKKANFSKEEKKERTKFKNYKIYESIKNIKKLLYRKGMGRGLVDFFSSTKLKDVAYDSSDFSEEHYLFRYIQEIDFIQRLKKRYPKWAPFLHITTGYMRTFSGIFIRVLVVLLLLTFFFQACGEFEVDLNDIRKNTSTMMTPRGNLVNSFFLSVKVFINSDIYPLQAGNNLTDAIIILASVLGYFTLAVLVGKISILLFPSVSLPRKREDDG